ncbi:MAG: tRNA guanosine(34) transglycosylase Tgt [Tenericutes bacterium GWC2_34_14]|nr:MAG: tRNA guanosine(34) transglycosylase Tgt [Tenericutes bacterium GWA2_35_7]OHE29659.1 MAG: tRNA guanosine(34) transglycosylase Tgt [Tenericutes bacterium GWC2_34_14]OHE34240.1 MAG: tRNA guanosine(34) transglycosylase Tgt [Tenericutes bacterium GWE2_34_108]OHE35570.1 MAG: tRNA guanosine(34) transglycosylase Tgt [Tenericutes bacterium GWF1_35_14]OHE38619.1 MAG: tRNA guanosine(34) transglycosylase Tgt [Tenericutes bacterium GWF2_35_184]OHE41617.1 MAG: tRNA guanosine(34) transglycosylase Tgt
MMSIKFEVLHVCKQSGARLGRLTTPHGVFETPFFMPVGTQATVKTLTPEEIKEVSEGLILGNTYHLWLQPGADIVADHGGIRGFMKWDGALLTDSGGFQVFSLTDMRKITEEGVHFKHHKNGSSLFMSPEDSIKVQEKLGADIIMSFDECPPPYATYEYMKDSVERTLRWAKRGKEALSTDQALFGIVQGGLNKELRQYSAEELIKMDFPGYSIGGLSVGETKHEMYEMTKFLNPILPFDKPRYLMGVGAPDDLVENVINGVDMFDCVLPTRIARHGTALTTEGKIVIKNQTYEKDMRPLDPLLYTHVSKYTRSYIRHLFKGEEILGMRLVTYQNLAYLKHLMQEIRQAIKEDRLLDFKEEMKKKTNYFKSR